jgi:hypothetical protein
MGKTITLICRETPYLKLGPGMSGTPGPWSIVDSVPGQVIAFNRGFAEFDEKEYPDWRKWVAAKGTPHIKVIDTGPPDL